MAVSNSTISVSLTLISLHPDKILGRLCPSCSEPMELHQPDTDLPDRMLWTCSCCATWFLMDIVPGQHEAVLVCLPDHGYFRSAIGGPDGAPPAT